MIVVFDASALISATLKADSISERALFRALVEPNHLILSPDVETEYREVLFRRKFDRFVPAERRELILETIAFAAQWVVPSETASECRDPKDDKYLKLTASGHADVIVSSDMRHLLPMRPWRGIAILSPGDFLALP